MAKTTTPMRSVFRRRTKSTRTSFATSRRVGRCALAARAPGPGTSLVGASMTAAIEPDRSSTRTMSIPFSSSVSPRSTLCGRPSARTAMHERGARAASPARRAARRATRAAPASAARPWAARAGARARPRRASSARRRSGTAASARGEQRRTSQRAPASRACRPSTGAPRAAPATPSTSRSTATPRRPAHERRETPAAEPPHAARARSPIAAPASATSDQIANPSPRRWASTPSSRVPPRAPRARRAAARPAAASSRARSRSAWRERALALLAASASCRRT